MTRPRKARRKVVGYEIALVKAVTFWTKYRKRLTRHAIKEPEKWLHMAAHAFDKETTLRWCLKEFKRRKKK